MIPGIDVSDYQGQVDWQAVAQSGVQFAFAKATEGTGFVCQTFPANWAGIRAAGLVRGAYHFAQPDANQPEAEADWFLSQVGTLLPGDLLALDLEAGSGDLTAWTLRWLARVAGQVGFLPLVYSGAWFLEPHFDANDATLSGHGLWLAAYSAVLPSPPLNWPVVAFWQYTDSATIPGVTGACDASFFNGDAIHLPLYGKPGAPAAAPPAHPAAAPAGAPSPGDYVSRTGDTLASIAAAWGCTPQALQQANPQLPQSAALAAGVAIHLPQTPSGLGPGPTQTYVVRSGDSLGAIAVRLGVSQLAIERSNPKMGDPNLIYPGEVLTIPVRQ